MNKFLLAGTMSLRTNLGHKIANPYHSGACYQLWPLWLERIMDPYLISVVLLACACAETTRTERMVPGANDLEHLSCVPLMQCICHG